MTALARGDARDISGRVRRMGRDLWCLYRRQGARAAYDDVAGMVAGRLYTDAVQLVVSRDLAVEETRPGAVPIHVRLVVAEDLPLLAQLNEAECNTQRTHRFEASLAEGTRGMLGLVGDEVIGWFWWLDAAQAARGSDLTKFGVTLAPDEMYGYELHVLPHRRGGGIAAAFLAEVESELARMGYARMLGVVASRNRPARWLYASRGYEIVMRRRIRTVLRRLVVVDATPYLSGRDGLRPLRPAGAEGRG